MEQLDAMQGSIPTIQEALDLHFILSKSDTQLRQPVGLEEQLMSDTRLDSIVGMSMLQLFQVIPSSFAAAYFEEYSTASCQLTHLSSTSQLLSICMCCNQFLTKQVCHCGRKLFCGHDGCFLPEAGCMHQFYADRVLLSQHLTGDRHLTKCDVCIFL